MSKATRFFLVGAAAILLVSLGTGLVAYYNGNLPMGRASDADLAFLPPNAAAVGYADVRSIMDSEFRQKLRQMLPTGEEKDKIQAELGVDLEKDIDSVAVAYVGGASPFDGALVVLRGRFNDGQIEAKAVEHGGTVGEYHGKRIVMLPAENHDNEPIHKGGSAGVAFLAPGVLALGEATALNAAIESGETGNDITKNTELMAVINDMRGSGNAWFVGKFDALAAQTGLPQEIKDHIPPVELFAVTVHVNGGLRGAVRADARDDKSAEQLRDVVRGALAAGKLMSGENKQMDAMLSSLQITGTGKTVGLTFNVPTEVLDVLNGVAAAKGLTAPAIKK